MDGLLKADVFSLRDEPGLNNSAIGLKTDFETQGVGLAANKTRMGVWQTTHADYSLGLNAITQAKSDG
jgi:hypothetical protein